MDEKPSLPPPIANAIDQIAKYVQQNDFSQVTVLHTGDISFERSNPKKQKSRKFDLFAIIGIIAFCTIGCSSMAVLLLGCLSFWDISIFTLQIDLTLGWIFVLMGVIELSISAIWDSIGRQQKYSRIAGSMARQTFFIAIGLALISKPESPILFGYFCIVGLFCLVLSTRGYIDQTKKMFKLLSSWKRNS